MIGTLVLAYDMGSGTTGVTFTPPKSDSLVNVETLNPFDLIIYFIYLHSLLHNSPSILCKLPSIYIRSKMERLPEF